MGKKSRWVIQAHWTFCLVLRLAQFICKQKKNVETLAINAVHLTVIN